MTNFANNYATRLSAYLLDDALTCTVDSVVGDPAVPYNAIIQRKNSFPDEIVTVTNVTGTTLTISRATEAVAGVQTAYDHPVGAVLRHIVTAGSLLTLGGYAISADPTYGDDATDATTHLQGLITAAGDGGVYVPRGTYRVSATLENVKRVYLAAGASIKATAAMDAVLRTSLTVNVADGGVTGAGSIDANNLADTTLHARYFARFEISGVALLNGKVNGVKLGDTGAPGRSAEAILSHLHVNRESPLTVPASSVGVLVENSGDHTLSDMVVSGFETGVYLPAAGGCMVSDVHVWTPPAQGRTNISFEDHANLSVYVQCHADTPAVYGFRFYGYQQTLIGCGTYNNPNDPAAVTGDGTIIGIRWDSTNSLATVVGHYFYGASTTSFAADIETVDGVYTGLHIVGSHLNEVLTERARRSRLVGLDVRDALTSATSMTVNPAAPADGAGFAIQTASKDRWKISSDGAAETGTNAGSGFHLQRYDDAGTVLGEVIWISRASGLIVVKSNLSINDGVNIVAGSTTGTQIGTNSAQKLGFFGVTPVVKPASIGAINATVIDDTYGSDEKDVLNNTRQRLQYLEWRLQGLGLLG